jgi:putative transposase
MPRRPRADVGGHVYHVLNRANGRAAIFARSADYGLFEALLADVRTEVGVGLFAWCVMPNHWHLIVGTEHDGQLGRFARLLTQRHAQAWHRAHGTRGQGHLYQGRFKSFPIQDDAHFLTACRYVERNPLRAGLVASAAEWPASSLGRSGARLVDPWPVPRPQRWRDLVEAAQTPQEVEDLRACTARGRPFGTPDWVERTTRRLGLEWTMRPRGRPRGARPEAEDR